MRKSMSLMDNNTGNEIWIPFPQMTGKRENFRYFNYQISLLFLHVKEWTNWVKSSLISIIEIHDFNYRNSWFQLSKFMISIFKIHDFNYRNSWFQLSKFMISIIEIHDFNYRNSWFQLSKFMISIIKIHDFNYRN